MEFKPKIRIYPLHRQVLVVANTRDERTWKAYCGPVPGHCHNKEYSVVLQYGDDVGEKIARVMFPEFDDLPYAK